MRETPIPIPALPPGARAIHLVLNPTRSSAFVPVQLPPGLVRAPYPRQTHRGHLPANILRFVLPGGWPPGAPLPTLRLQSARAFTHVLKFVVLDANERVLSVYDSDTPGGFSAAERNADPRIDSEPSTEEYLNQVWDAIEAITDAHKRKSSLFFFDYDLHFNPELWDNLVAEGADPLDWVYPDMIGSSVEMNDVTNAFGIVMTRLERRINDRAAGNPASWDIAENADVDLLSRLQLDLYQYYQDRGMTLGAQIGGAFEKFASGELRLPFPSSGTLEPSSGVYFLFGEFALLALDHGLEKPKWRSRSRFRLRTQEIMAQVYAPLAPVGGQRDDTHYTPANYGPNRRPPLPSLASRYASLSDQQLADQATRNVQDYMGRGMAP